MAEYDAVNDYFAQLRAKTGGTPTPYVAPVQYSGTGDVRGSITGGAKVGDTYNFHDQGGNTLGSMNYNEYMSKYANPDTGGLRADVANVNGLENYYSAEAVERRRQQALIAQQQAAARAANGASVSIDGSMGNMSYNPQTQQYYSTNAPSYMSNWSVSNPNGSNWLGSGKPITPLAQGTPNQAYTAPKMAPPAQAQQPSNDYAEMVKKLLLMYLQQKA